MAEDLNFNKCLEIMRELHEEEPTLRFGEVIQTAIDKKRGGANIDLHNCTSKEIYNCLVKYLEEIKIIRGKK